MNSGFFYFSERLGALKNKTQTVSGLGWINSKYGFSPCKALFG